MKLGTLFRKKLTVNLGIFVGKNPNLVIFLAKRHFLLVVVLSVLAPKKFFEGKCWFLSKIMPFKKKLRVNVRFYPKLCPLLLLNKV